MNAVEEERLPGSASQKLPKLLLAQHSMIAPEKFGSHADATGKTFDHHPRRQAGIQSPEILQLQTEPVILHRQTKPDHRNCGVFFSELQQFLTIRDGEPHLFPATLRGSILRA